MNERYSRMLAVASLAAVTPPHKEEKGQKRKSNQLANLKIADYCVTNTLLYDDAHFDGGTHPPSKFKAAATKELHPMVTTTFADTVKVHQKAKGQVGNLHQEL